MNYVQIKKAVHHIAVYNDHFLTSYVNWGFSPTLLPISFKVNLLL